MLDDGSRRTWGQLPNLLATLIAAGWLVGAVDGAYLAGPNRVRSALVSAVVASLPAAATGLLLIAALALVWRGQTLRRLRASLDRYTTRDPAADREPVIVAHAYVLLGTACVVACALVFVPVLELLWNLQETELARSLLLLSFPIALAGSLVATIAIVGPLAKLLRRIDTRVPLPLPPSPFVRYLLFVATPICGLLWVFAREYREILGPGVHLFSLLFPALVAPLIGYAVGAAKENIPLLHKPVIGRVIGGLVMVACLASSWAVGSRRQQLVDTFAAVEGGITTSLGLATIETLFPDAVDPSAPERKALTIKLGPRFSDRLSGEQQRHYNVVWVIIDAIRADHVQSLGYDKATMPNFDKLASESLLFSRAYSQSSATVLSFPSMFTGSYPATLHWEMSNKRIQPVASSVTVAERFKKAGYTTGLILSEHTKKYFVGIQQGYDEVITLKLAKNTKQLWKERRSPIALSKAIEYIAEKAPGAKARSPFFLTVYFPDPHSPYKRHADVDSSNFATGPIGNYDTELAFSDRYLGQLITHLKDRPKVWDDTIFVVVADHGEEFGEHGGTRHARSCHIESVHVPLLIRIPGIAPKKLDAPVALIDVLPTLIECTGIARDGGMLHGHSLLIPALTDHAELDRPIFCSVVSQKGRIKFFRRSVRQKHFALLNNVGTGRETLFDMAQDPEEKTNLAASRQHADELKRLRALLRATRTGNLNHHKSYGKGGQSKTSP